jgi:hypothetical protein
MHLGMAILSLRARLDLASKLVGDEVKAIANPEHRRSQREHLLIRRRGFRVID